MTQPPLLAVMQGGEYRSAANSLRSFTVRDPEFCNTLSTEGSVPCRAATRAVVDTDVFFAVLYKDRVRVALGRNEARLIAHRFEVWRDRLDGTLQYDPIRQSLVKYPRLIDGSMHIHPEFDDDYDHL